MMNHACAAACGAISSVVERHIDIVKAGGPIPPSRTKYKTRPPFRLQEDDRSAHGLFCLCNKENEKV